MSVISRVANSLPDVKTLKGYARPIKRPVENAVAFTAVQKRISAAPSVSDLKLDGAHTFVLGNGAFGSLGDQALAAGTQELASHRSVPISILIPGDHAPWKAAGLAQIEALEPYARIRAARVTSQGEAAFEQSNVIVIGADTIDGKYEHPFLAMRVNALNHAAINGFSAKLANFSMSESPTRLSIYLLKKLQDNVELWARDENSKARAQRFLDREVHLAPDVAAVMKPLVTQRVVDVAQRRDGRPFVVLVPNGHMSTVFGVARDELVSFWTQVGSELSEDMDVVVMPHDVRKSHDDPGFSAKIVESLEKKGVNADLFVTKSAMEAKGLLSRADLSISGRMHACVASMSSGTPSVGLDYLQKFQGQFQWYAGLGRTMDFEDALNTKGVLDAVAELREITTNRDLPPKVTHDHIPWL